MGRTKQTNPKRIVGAAAAAAKVDGNDEEELVAIGATAPVGVHGADDEEMVVALPKIKGGVGKKAPRLNANGKPRKQHRFRPGTVALREIKRYQKTTDLLLRRAPFRRLVREIAQEIKTDGVRFQLSAMEALQEAGEMFTVDVLGEVNNIAIARGHVTISDKDFALAKRIGTVTRKYAQ